jgi:hypothetical protein
MSFYSPASTRNSIGSGDPWRVEAPGLLEGSLTQILTVGNVRSHLPHASFFDLTILRRTAIGMVSLRPCPTNGWPC